MLKGYWGWFLYADYFSCRGIILAMFFLFISVSVALLNIFWSGYDARNTRVIALESQWLLQTDLLSKDFERSLVDSADLDLEAVAYHFNLKIKLISNNIYFYGETENLIKSLGLFISEQSDIQSFRIQSTLYKPMLAISL